MEFPVLNQVSIDTLTQRVAQTIREAIVQGRFPSGMRLRESDLAHQLGVSRGTVRAGLQRLAHEGYIRILPYRGAFVLELTPDEMIEIYSLRGLLEGYAAASEITALRTPECWTRVTERYEALVSAIQAGKFEEFVELDDAFHHAICSASRNTRLVGFWLTLSASLQAQFASRVRQLYSANEIIADHTHLLQVLWEGEPIEIELVIREHYLSTVRRMLTASQEGIGSP